MKRMEKRAVWDDAQVVPINRKGLSDEALALGLKSGDMGAVTELYERFGGLVNRLIWRILGTDDEHEDVVQNTFLSIIAASKKLHKPTSLKDWVIGISVRTALKELRRRKYRNKFTPRADLDALAPALTGVTDDGKFLVNAFYRVLRQLSPEMQVFIVLRRLEQQTNEEVAASLGLSVRTAKRRIAESQRRFVEKAANDPFLGSLILDESNGGD